MSWSAPGPYEGAVSSDPYASQPAELRRVVGKDLWEGLDGPDKGAITSLYNRFSRLGFWRHVDRIRTESEHAPGKGVKKGAPPWCGTWVEGDTPSVYFSGNALGLKNAFVESHRMCWDPWWMAMMHAGQHSFREISGSDALHVSIDQPVKDTFDAHIDRHSPVTTRDGLSCFPDPVAGAQHHLTEAALSSGAFRGYLGIPLRPGLLHTLQARPGVRPDLPELFEQNESLAEFSRPLYSGQTFKGWGRLPLSVGEFKGWGPLDLIRVSVEGRFSMGFLEGEQRRKRKPTEPAVHSLDLQLLDLARGGR